MTIETARPLVGSLLLLISLLGGSALAQDGVSLLWETAKLTDPAGSNSDAFGRSVAIDGETAIVCASRERAFIFVRDGGAWSEQAQLVMPPGSLPRSVAVQGDVALVTDIWSDVGGNNAGAVHVFRRTGTTWSLEQVVVADEAQAHMALGVEVALDGDSFAVGAPNYDVTDSEGAVFVFVLEGGTWVQQQLVRPVALGAPSEYGMSLALDGDTLVVGAPTEDDGPELDVGAVYVFTRSGTTWTQQQRLQPDELVATDGFGRDVALDGDSLAVGAPGFFFVPTMGGEPGQAFVFGRELGVWSQQARLVPADQGPRDIFGAGLALEGDTLVVGALGRGFAYWGTAFLFVRDPLAGTWSERHELVAVKPGWGDDMGRNIALSGDCALIAAQGASNGSASDAGAAFVYEDLLSQIPWAKLPFALAGTHGEPTLVGAGELLPGAWFTLTLAGALESSPAWLVVGLSDAKAPFKGGVMLPSLDIIKATNTNASGALPLTARWPAGIPSGFRVTVQFWIRDFAAPFNYAASNAVRGETP